MHQGGFIGRVSMIIIKCRGILSFLPLPMLCCNNSIQLKMEIAVFCTEHALVFYRQTEYVKMLLGEPGSLFTCIQHVAFHAEVMTSSFLQYQFSTKAISSPASLCTAIQLYFLSIRPLHFLCYVTIYQQVYYGAKFRSKQPCLYILQLCSRCFSSYFSYRIKYSCRKWPVLIYTVI